MVKVCGITRREDALASAEAGASAIGFIFYPKSPRFVAPELVASLGEALPVWKVGVFVNEPPAMIAAVMSAALLDVAQIYGGDPPPGARVWRAFRVEGSFDPSHIGRTSKPCFSTEPAMGIRSIGALRATFTQTQSAQPKIIVAGGLDASNVAEAIRVVRPWGVDASSSLETSPGVKDREKIRRFVQAARLPLSTSRKTSRRKRKRSCHDHLAAG